jgi:hypothetical protein
MSATNRTKGARVAGDFYATPEWCVHAIMPHLPIGSILDPCAGDGAIFRGVRSWRELPATVVPKFWALEIDATRRDALHDLATPPRTFLVDALSVSSWPAADLTLTNPPYLRAEAFVRRALDEVRHGATVAMLLRLNFLEGQARAALHREHPADVYVLPRRPSFTGKGTDATGYGWFCWGPGRGNRWSILDVPKGGGT